MKITVGPASLYFLATKRSNVNCWVTFLFWLILITCKGFPGSSAVKTLPTNAGDTGDMGSVPGSGRSSGVGNVNLLQDSCLKNSVDRGAWWATVHGVTKSQTRLSNWPHTHICKRKQEHWHPCDSDSFICPFCCSSNYFFFFFKTSPLMELSKRMKTQNCVIVALISLRVPDSTYALSLVAMLIVSLSFCSVPLLTLKSANL